MQKPILFLFLSVSINVLADTTLPSTEISSFVLDELGRFKLARPVQKRSLTEVREYFGLQEELNTIPGVFVRTEGSPGLSLRGSQSSVRTLVLLEGVPLNFADGAGFNPLFIPKENLESVQVLKSPASSSFGRDAMAGALGFSSRRIEGLDAFASGGSFGRSEIYSAYGTPNKNKTHFQISAYQEHTDGNYPYNIPRGVDRTTRINNDSEILRGTLLFDGKTEIGEQPLSFKTYHLASRQIGTTPGSIYFSFPQTINNYVHLHSLEGMLVLPENISITSQSTFAQTQLNYSNSTSRSDNLRQIFRLQKSFNTFLVEIFDQASYDLFAASYLLGGQKTQLLNEVGANIQAPLSKKILLQASARADTSLGETLPSVGLNSEIENGWQSFIHYSMGFHPPSLTQKYTQGIGFSGNPSLVSEHSSEVDLGFEKTWENETSLRFEVFQRTMTDLIENRTAVINGLTVLQPQNVGSAYIYGFEAEGKWRWFVNWDAGLNYQQGWNQTLNRALLFTPMLQTHLGLGQNLNERLSLRTLITAWSNYYDLDSTNNLVSLGPWTTVDVFVSYGLFDLPSKVFLRLALINILDQQRELTYGYPESQRSFKLTLHGMF